MVRIYDRYASMYDHLFERFFYPTKLLALSSIDFPANARVLDIGIGSGMSLTLFPEHCRIVGIDISYKMLVEARKKACQSSKNISLITANGERLPFEDNAFDFILMSHVLSVIPNPERALQEVHRTVKKEGNVVIINSFLSANPVFRRFQKAMNPVCYCLGWKNNISINRIHRADFFDITSIEKHKPHTPWSVVRLRPL